MTARPEDVIVSVIGWDGMRIGHDAAVRIVAALRAAEMHILHAGVIRALYAKEARE